ncbi:cytochrome P450 [Croceicoccus sediminis]|uniref:cytochrome P450 n=1 Tax=Croceicoccus sediminis TaxID=2571150 RepID=UPI0011831D93|nr:cytochrome P450 [Croceicoccus sediminis]
MNVATANVDYPSNVRPEQIVDFDVFAPEGGREDFYGAWKKLHADGLPEMVWTPHNGGHWIATRIDLLDEIFSDHDLFSSRVILLPKEVGEQHKGLLPTTLDPPEHRGYRNVLNSGFAPRAIRHLESDIRQLTADLIEAFRLKGHCDFQKEFAGILPIQVFMTMFGLPLEDSAKLKKWSDDLTRPDGSITMEDGIARLKEYMIVHVLARRENPQDDLLSRIANGKVGDNDIEVDAANQLAVQVLIAGVDTVVNFLDFAIVFLARNPSHRKQLVDNPELVPAGVEELFRRFPLVTIGREVAKDMNYHGAELKRGEMVALATVLGGLDEQANPEPMKVDFNRHGARHVTFGTGPHRCPGALLARTEMRIALEEWLKRIPEFDLDPGMATTITGGITASVDEVKLVWDPATTSAG